MLRRYDHRPTFHEQQLRSGERIKGNKFLIWILTIVGILVGVQVINSNFFAPHYYYNAQRSLICLGSGVLSSRLHRHLCQVDTTLQEDSFAASFSYDTNNNYDSSDVVTERPSGTVAMVLAIPDCFPIEDDEFYDAVAVWKDSICHVTSDNPASGSTLNTTFYAILHPDAIVCNAGATSRRLNEQDNHGHDRVQILEELGFWVVLWSETVCAQLISDKKMHVFLLTLSSNIFILFFFTQTQVSVSDIPSSNVQEMVDPSSTLRDLIRLHAFNFTSHPAAVLMNWNTIVTGKYNFERCFCFGKGFLF